MSNDRGHVFAVRADLGHLACDDIIVPVDRALSVTDHWLHLLGGRRPGFADLDVDPPTWRTQRYARLLGAGDDDEPRIWFVDTGGSDHAQISWYTDALRNVLEAIHHQVDDARHGRARRLAALPLVGVGAGGAAARRGDVIAAVLDLLDQRAAADQDIALVLWNSRDHAAVQHVRRERQTASLPLAQEDTAQRLAGTARRGELALFLGAGVSASAGLPLWGDLLTRLLDEAGVEADEANAIRRLDPRDAATLAVGRLEKTGTTLPVALRAILTQRRYGVAHALLAALPVEQAVTTNYDRLFEIARADQRRNTAMLPFEEPARDWLLKLHGDLMHDDGIVLTRDDYLRFGERSGALGGVVQGMLMTKHVLFAGFSLTDENFFRMAHGTRQALGSAGRGPRTIGTALELRGDTVKEELWAGELDYLAMADPRPRRQTRHGLSRSSWTGSRSSRARTRHSCSIRPTTR